MQTVDLLIDKIENLYIDTERINNLLEILVEFIEEEGLSSSTDERIEEYEKTCFFNRLPMFYSLLEVIQKENVSTTKQLGELIEETRSTKGGCQNGNI